MFNGVKETPKCYSVLRNTPRARIITLLCLEICYVGLSIFWSFHIVSSTVCLYNFGHDLLMIRQFIFLQIESNKWYDVYFGLISFTDGFY